MKFLFSIRGKLLIGLIVMMFSASALAQTPPTWMKEDVDWSKYSKFLVKPLNIDDTQLVRPPWAVDDPDEWTLDLENLEAIQAIFRDVLRHELSSDDGYAVVYTPGPEVLEVEVEILSVMPWMRPGSDPKDEGLEVTTLGSGELTASARIRDSSTRELLVLFEGEKAVGEEYKEFTRENNVSNIERMFKRFGMRLRGAMDRIHGKTQ